MDDAKKSDSHLSSAVAFVEGGIQDACDDACSICLEAFCDSDPSSVTNCKHEFHLQCILEWCQRSSQCPMCWQPIGLKDPTSQELLDAVERERNFRFNPSRSATVFRHPTLGDFELQHLPVDASDAELEERIIQHLAAAAAMGRRHMARREGHRHRSSGQVRPQFVVFSEQPNSASVSSASPPPQTLQSPPPPINHTEVQEQPSNNMAVGVSNTDDRAGPSEFQAFSDSIRTKLNSFSLRYKETILKNTRGWKERFFSRGSAVNTDTATVSSGVEHVEIKDKEENSSASVSHRVDDETPAYCASEG